MSESIGDKRAEFFRSVWNHSEDEFQAAFDERRLLNIKETTLLKHISELFDAGESDESVARYLGSVLSGSDKKLIEVLLQICGITRNKILQDIKASASTRRRQLKLSNHLALASHAPTWGIAGPYLVKKLRKVLHHGNISDPRVKLLEALNQATWPGYIRQERAKRSGHEAEYRIATLMNKCGIPFVPEEKADNPLCRDAMWNEVSFDIIVPDMRAPKVCIKSTVHTSNIGQYGESKDHLEIDEARRMIDQLPGAQRPTLVGFIDGVGFESNSAGLNGVLDKADEFCQFSTIWKLPVIAAAKLGRKCQIFLSSELQNQHRAFLDRYVDSIEILPAPPPNGVEAGNAVVKLSD